MFTSGRKYENLYTGLFGYAESISNRIHAGKPRNPRWPPMRIADFDISLELFDIKKLGVNLQVFRVKEFNRMP